MATSIASQIRTMLELIRFSHTVFALPFALSAAMLAWRTPLPDGSTARFSWHHVIGILICMVGARSAAMAFNRLVDRRIDADNPRTETRHLPRGAVTTTGVALFTLVMSALFIAGTLLFLPNRWPLYLSLPFLLYLFGYSFAKRFTQAAHLWLGSALLLAPVGAWIALRGGSVQSSPVDLLPALLLGLAVMFWVTGFDIIYACQDAAFDRRAGLASVPARWGVPTALKIAAGSHLIMLLLLAALPSVCHAAGVAVPLGTVYYVAIAMAAVLLVYEHRLVRPDDLDRVNMAFFHVNAIISLGLFFAITVDLFVHQG